MLHWQREWQYCLEGLEQLLFPSACACCGEQLVAGGELCCAGCELRLRPLNVHRHRFGKLHDSFYGVLNVRAVAALYAFGPGSAAQTLIHRLKYEHQPAIGVALGRRLGTLIADSELFDPIDSLLPVPLHAKRLRQRGYNQAEKLARGLSETLGRIPVELRAVRRRVHTRTQTRKTGFERMDNMNRVFEVVDAAALRGRHLLLVDDVLTTGSTLTELGRTLLPAEPASISIAVAAAVM